MITLESYLDEIVEASESGTYIQEYCTSRNHIQDC